MRDKINWLDQLEWILGIMDMCELAQKVSQQ